MIVFIRPENENQSTAEKSNRGTRRATSFSGPLMLPTRASANSLSAPIKSSGGDVHLILVFIFLEQAIHHFLVFAYIH